MLTTGGCLHGAACVQAVTQCCRPNTLLPRHVVIYVPKKMELKYVMDLLVQPAEKHYLEGVLV